MPREWTEQRVHESVALFEERGVGLWLARERQSSSIVGFCGFLHAPATARELQLVYAVFERFTGRGYATEMAFASVVEARRQAASDAIVATVDEVNAASYGSWGSWVSGRSRSDMALSVRCS